MNCFTKFASAVLIFGGLSACTPMGDGATLAESPQFATESALAIVNSVATDSERGTVAFSSLDEEPTAPSNAMNLAVSCGSFNPRSACNGANQITVDWKDCFLPVGDGRVQGGWISTYNNSAACSQAQTGALQNNHGFTRTSSGMTISGYYGGSLTFNTNTHSAYNSDTIPSSGISVFNYGGTRAIEINGAHRILRDKDAKTLFDLSVMTPSSITMTGARSTSNRQVSSGSVRVYNNTDKYIATSTFNNLRWTRNNCCYPTSGIVTTSYEDSKTGSSILEFTSTCGSAKFTDTDSTSKTITLVQCE